MDNKIYYAPEIPKDKAQTDIGYQILKQMRPFLSGAQYEKDTTAWRKDTDGVSDSFWQNKDLDWHLPAKDRETYYTVVHPTIARYTNSIIKHLFQQEKKEVTILDIAGGNGDLGERIIKDAQAQFPELSIKYRVVDYSKDDVNIANERFNALKGQTEHIDALAIHKNMFDYHYDAEEMKNDPAIGLSKRGVDIVINSGGLLNSAITESHDEVARNFNRMYAELIDEERFIISSGLSPLSVNSDDHLKNGLDIRNLHDMDTNRQMHVVYKRRSRSERAAQTV